MQVLLIKQAGGILRPAFDADVEALERVKTGKLVKAKIEQPRNAAYLSKFHVMIDFAFQYWEPSLDPVNGIVPIKDREKFREDVTILAGFREAVMGLKGVRWRARSISFAAMEEDEFNSVYKAVFGVLWTKVLQQVPNMTEAEAHNLINQMASFA